MIEQRDLLLLHLLQDNARLSNAELADQTAMSTSSCWRRVKALEDQGVISRYTAVIDPPSMGLRFEAIVHIQLNRHDRAGVDLFMETVLQRGEVVDCVATTGTADYHLRVICRDIEAYNSFLEEVLFAMPCLRSAQTNMVLKRIKTNGPVQA
ncbi:Lrp/AsnC family transcriptional regulator [Rhodophyticola sp. CCM32]|uniref:Lrp/AsnC family transcriptional regulator n=1 Tax=Rhodophyticola sp. CCM32 TaxID=2916397 RepID=UPI0026966410